MNEQDDDNN